MHAIILDLCAKHKVDEDSFFCLDKKTALLMISFKFFHINM